MEDPGDRPFRRVPASLAILLGLQFLGYVLIWLQLHATVGPGNMQTSSQVPISLGWYDPESPYAHWFASHHLVGQILATHLSRKWLLACGFLLACVGYVGALETVRRGGLELSPPKVVIITLALALPLITLPRILSGDLWGYVMYGRVAVLHGGNPITNLPADYPTDPLLPRMYWKTTPSIYGPGWVLVCIMLTHVAQLCGGAAWTYAVLFKSFIVLVHFLNLWIVRRILRVVRPEHQTWGTAIYAWNPLCLFEFAGSAHNDCFLLMLLLIGMLFMVKRRPTTVVGWLVAAGLTKLPGALSLPIYLRWTLDTTQNGRFKLVFGQAVCGALVAAALYAPFWQGLRTFNGTAHAPNVRFMWNSLPAYVATVLERRYAPDHHASRWSKGEPVPGTVQAKIQAGVKLGSLLCFAACFAALLARPIIDFEQWRERMAGVFLAYLFFAAIQFNPWYGTWIVPLAALSRRPPWSLLIASMACLAFYLPLKPPHDDLLVLVPLGIACAVHLRLALRRRSSLQVC